MRISYLPLLLLIAVAACAPINALPPPTAPIAPSAPAAAPTRPPAQATGTLPPIASAAPTASAPGYPATAIPHWVTYTNSNWHIAMDYPQGWTVRETPAGVAFAGPDGASIVLMLGPAAARKSKGLEPYDVVPTPTCTHGANPHGFETLVCAGPAGRPPLTQLIAPGSSTGVLELSLYSSAPGDSQVYDAMIASLRPTP